MKKVLMICVLVGATIINSSAIQFETPKTAFEANISPPSDEPVAKLEKVGNQSYQLNYMEIPEGKVTVIIRDNSSRVIYRDVIFAEKFFSKSYDLSHLELGTYLFEVTDAQSVKLMAEELHLTPKDQSAAHIVNVELLDTDRLAISMANADGLVRTLKIFDEVGLIYEEAVPTGDFAKKYRFENVESLSKLSIQVMDRNGYIQYLSAL
nr:hypothetical protein [Cytophagales bacterium]